MIDLYTAATPNGYKITIALEEMVIAYNLINVDLMAGEQKTPDFLKMNPNGRIPVIVDRNNDDFVIFESGAILIYLAEMSGKFYGSSPKQRTQILQWLMFQMSAVGPMMGQANVFFRYFPEKIDAVIDRYQNESKRLLSILNGQLKDNEYLVGDYSIADMATWPWAKIHAWSGVDISDLEHLQRWLDLVYQRPAVNKASSLPPPGDPEDIVKSAKAII
ncbi:MAG: glutathione S-transferase [Gammaproteobacteria bacterium]|nr:MAG: glutathione S-transferase [Gammaproteobacteria bacterium]